MASENGETGPIDNIVSLPEAMVMAGFFAISIWNCVQTFVYILMTFKNYSGLYFWSMIVANAAIPLRQIFAFLRFYGLASSIAMTPLVSVSFWVMVTGQSVVLYSRLCLVVGEPMKLRWVLAMIAFTFFFVEVPVSALHITSNVPGHEHLAQAFTVFENCQTALISAQEALISGMYVREAKRAFKPMQVTKGDRVKKTMRGLVWLFVVTTVLDLSLMGLAYSGKQFAIMTSYKGVVYSIKLQIEGIVLTNLTKLVRRRSCTCDSRAADNYLPNPATGHEMWAGEPARTRMRNAAKKNSVDGQSNADIPVEKTLTASATVSPERHSAELRRIFGTDENS